MFGIHDFGLFLTTAIVLNLTPGQDTMYILGRSLSQGRQAGVASVLGISCGTLIHTLAAALGLSALLAASATAFMVVKLAGAAYLVFLGLKMLLKRTTPESLPATLAPARAATIFRQGLVTNVLNPKVALFFIAFMPQFIVPESPHKFWAFVVLGLSFIGTGSVWCLSLVWFSARLGDRLRTSLSFSRFLNRLAGTLFVGLGVRLAATK